MKNIKVDEKQNLKDYEKSQRQWKISKTMKTTVHTNTLKLMKNIKVDEKKKVKPRSVKRASLTLKKAYSKPRSILKLISK